MNKYLNINFLLKASIISFGLFPIIPNKLKGLLVIILLILSLIYLIKVKPKGLKIKTFIINSSLYLTYVLTIANTSNISRAIMVLTETRLTALLLPLIFLFLSQNKNIYNVKTFKLFKKTFVFSTLLFSVVYFIYLPFGSTPANPIFNFPSVFFFRNGVTKIPFFGIDPIYASIYLGIALIFIFNNIIEKRKLKKLQIIFSFIFILILLVLSSKMAIIAVILILSILIFKHFIKKVRLRVIFLFSSLIIILILLQIPTVKSRTKELFNKETFTKYERNNSTSIRISIYKCGIKIIQNNIFFGVGIGDVNDELSNCYGSVSNDLVYGKYNSHNQYMSVFIGGGFISLLIFFYFLLYNIRLGIKLKSNIFTYILIFYSINFLTENVLERQNGVILFYFIISYFSQAIINQKHLHFQKSN